MHQSHHLAHRPVLHSLLIAGLVSAMGAQAGAQGSDDCASAPTIAGPGLHAVDTNGATGPDADPSCGNMGSDVWFEWTATDTGTALLEMCDANYDCVLALWDGAGCPTQVVACNDDSCGLQSVVDANVVAGNTYMIQVGGYNGATGTGTLGIHVQPANDDCTSAQSISGQGLFAVDTNGATGPDADPGCGNMAADVWFEWTATETGAALLDVCDANYDCVLALWEGSGCPNQVIACNDDSCGLQSVVDATVVAGNTYMIQVGGYNGATGTGTLSVSVAAPPANDDCASAEPITGEGVFAFDCSSATTDGAPDAGCGPIGKDVWFVWTAPWDGATTMTTCNLASWDTQLAVYPWQGCPEGSALTCNDDACGLRSRMAFFAAAGTDYLIRIGSFNGGTAGPGALEISQGGSATDCNNPPPGPDVIVGNISDTLQWGTVGDITGYSIGATACNVGDSTMPWEGDTNHHPVIGQNLYRLQHGRFEQVGMSWVKHGFASATEDYCCPCIPPGSGQIMGVGCADTYWAGLNGDQGGWGVGGLGPRSEINPVTGDFPFPYGTMGQTGDAIYKRLQVHNDDLDPDLNVGATYFAEVQYVNPDDAAAGHGNNNTSWRPAVQGGFVNGGWPLVLTDYTRATQPAIHAWQEADPLVTLEPADVPGDGRFFVGSRATSNGDGTWHYEIAVHNLTSARAADGLRLQLPRGASVSGAEFHGVAHHSGEPFDTQDWDIHVGADSIEWTVAVPSGVPGQPEPNALRWGTTFTFRFDADVVPVDGTLDLDLFAPGGAGEPDEVHVRAQVPGTGCAVSTYCTALANSSGAPAAISYTGSASIAANDFVLQVRALPLNQPGIFYYGAGQTKVPFGNGNRCVSPGGVGLFRLPPLDTGSSGQASHALDNTNPPVPAGQLIAGDTRHFQFWFRDPDGGGAGFNLSDALTVTFCP
ncbi:MAG: hypothetical protein QF860_15660 [Planctomycetota bacterium]|nr:hypothetical protein [Planctomycetota bacterium]